MSHSLHIRPAQTGDVAALSALARQTYAAAFGHSMSEADLAAHLARNLSDASVARIIAEDTVLVAELEGRLVGYVQFGAAAPDYGHGAASELRRLYVHADFQNAGVGARLMEAALRELEGGGPVALDVWEHNHGAQRFYRRFGFEAVGSRAFAVDSGAETSLDLIMVRSAGDSRDAPT
jgi:ribosomal protein S18 acetylase RimI-like enzyme